MLKNALTKYTSLPLANRQDMPPEDSLLPMDETPYRRLGMTILLVTFVVFGLWAQFAPLRGAVVAVGRIIVASQNKQVQHLDGGIVKTINVQDGDSVHKGQVLLELDDIQWRSQLENVQGQLWDAEASLVRLAAERDDAKSIIWPDSLQKASDTPMLAEILKTQNQLFQSRKQALSSSQDVLVQRLAQTRKQIEGNQNAIVSLKKRRESLDSDVNSLQKLAGRNLVAKTTLRQMQRDYEEVEGDTVKTESEVARLNDSVAEIKQQIALTKEEYLKEVSANISDTQTKRIQLLAQKQSLEDKLSRVAITAPVTGKVKGFNIVTLGGVITAGQIIMEIVPDEQEFKIVAELSPTDIDEIKAGQIAEIKITSSNDTRFFPVIHAELIDISGDTFTNQNSQQSFYKATLKIQDDALKLLKEKNVSLIPGMPAEVFLQTRSRTLMSYLLKPLSDVISHSFNES
jgi:epimerase transport system membrane fusion protein